jgi:hypothetical protein
MELDMLLNQISSVMRRSSEFLSLCFYHFYQVLGELKKKTISKKHLTFHGTRPGVKINNQQGDSGPVLVFSLRSSKANSCHKLFETTMPIMLMGDYAAQALQGKLRLV